MISNPSPVQSRILPLATPQGQPQNNPQPVLTATPADTVMFSGSRTRKVLAGSLLALGLPLGMAAGATPAMADPGDHTEIEEQISDLNTRVGELEGDVSGVTSNQQAQDEKIRQLGERVGKVETSLSSYNTTIQQLRDSIPSVDGKASQQSVDELNKKLTALNTTVTTLQQSQTGLPSAADMKLLKKQQEAIKTQLEQVTSTNDEDAKKRAEEFSKQLDEKFSDVEQKIADAQASVSEVREEIISDARSEILKSPEWKTQSWMTMGALGLGGIGAFLGLGAFVKSGRKKDEDGAGSFLDNTFPQQNAGAYDDTQQLPPQV